MATEALYQEIILEHNRKPRNFREIADADRKIEGRNPLCGDALTLWVKLENDVITDVSFRGQGCAISKASASLMTEAIKGHTVAEAEALFDRFHALVTTPPDAPVSLEGLGKLAVFAGVREYPARVKCASLAWHTMKNAVEAVPVTARTEEE
jgi:nitrogen fixation NifU-like protein